MGIQAACKETPGDTKEAERAICQEKTEIRLESKQPCLKELFTGQA
jgi:hypothetical protein